MNNHPVEAKWIAEGIQPYNITVVGFKKVYKINFNVPEAVTYYVKGHFDLDVGKEVCADPKINLVYKVSVSNMMTVPNSQLKNYILMPENFRAALGIDDN